MPSSVSRFRSMPEAWSRSKSSRVAPVGRFANRNLPARRRASVAVTSMRRRCSRVWVRLQPSVWAWDAFLAAVGASRRCRGEGDRFEGGDVSGVADRDPQARFGDSVSGEDRAGEGGDADGVAAVAVMDDDLPGSEFGWDGIPVAAPVDQRLPGGGAFLGDERLSVAARSCGRSARRQPLCARHRRAPTPAGGRTGC